jgi:hypothetical protein
MTAQKNHLLQARLAEYAAHRAEIGWRTQAQQTLLSLNVTAAGLVGSAALTADARRPLLLLLPYICTALGMAWLDHGRSIAATAKYIRTVVWHGVQEAVGLTTPEERTRLWSRDDYHVAEKTEFTPRFRLSITLPYGLVFNVPSIAALAFSVGTLDSPGLIALWTVGVILTLCSLVWWSRFRPIKL